MEIYYTTVNSFPELIKNRSPQMKWSQSIRKKKNFFLNLHLDITIKIQHIKYKDKILQTGRKKRMDYLQRNSK